VKQHQIALRFNSNLREIFLQLESPVKHLTWHPEPIMSSKEM